MEEKVLQTDYVCPIKVFVTDEFKENFLYWNRLDSNLIELNKVFYPLNISFEYAEVRTFSEIGQEGMNDIPINQLTTDLYSQVRRFISDEDTLNLWIVSEDIEEVVTIRGNTIIAERKHGFADIDTHPDFKTIVINENSILDPDVLIHEMGHIFSLEHTFKNTIPGLTYPNCNLTNDKICDTPLDPGDAFAPFIDYYNCEMVFKYKGITYKPDIQNYMSYFWGYCKDKGKHFSEEQYKKMEERLNLYLKNNTLIKRKIEN